MSEIVAIVEGPTEQAFVRDQIAAHLGLLGISIWPVLSGRHRDRGGVKKWQVSQRDMVNTLRERRYCTTMFDYYAMPADWPGREESMDLPWSQRAAHVEQCMSEDINSAMGDRFNANYFVPYVQLHEFEALAFADVAALAEVVAPLQHSSVIALSEKFKQIVDEAGHPEAIDDGYETCPSRRITKLVPAYRKPIHGPIITSRIGIPALCQACNHFAKWIDRLEKCVE